MPEERHDETRRLAAMMQTDIVGYTAMTQRDETVALALLSEHNSVLRAIFPRFRGTEIKALGDGFLVEFSSALDAVNCACEIQTKLSERNKSNPDLTPIRIRIGLHVGDIVHRDNDVLGDGVNITSRIEPLAEPGGIALSQQVHSQVWNKVDLPTVSLGPQKLKNVHVPIEVYRLVLAGSPGDTVSRRWRGASADRERRIAVLPFANISPDPQDAYLADGITEELIFTLSKISELKVIAKTSVMRYREAEESVTEIGRELGVNTIIEGSVRKAGKQIRTTVQLIDVDTQEHLWSEAYDAELDDLFAMQRETAEQVLEALRLRLLPAEREEIAKVPTKNRDAHTHYLRGRYAWSQWNEAALLNAIDYFQQAIALDPKFALAYAGIADTYSLMAYLEYLPPGEAYPKAEEAARRALALDDSLAEAHSSLAMIKVVFCEDLEGAEQDLLKAIDLNPNCAAAHQWYALVLSTTGRSEEAIRERELAEELDPLALVFNVAVGQLLNAG
jgi:adenylate cyclase